jgi:lipopolysaccharide transport system permease protein
LFRFRELLWVLSWRDIKVRYKQTAIGILWSLLRPLLTMSILTLVFGYFIKLPVAGNSPYPLLVLSGILPWQFFASTTSEGSNSLLDNQNLVTKVYFPRLIIPLSTCLASFADFMVALLLLLPMMAYFDFTLSWQIVFLPAFALLLLLLSFACGAWLTALNVKYRDFRYALPFVIQIGLYLSPVGYSTGIVPEHLQHWYALNPMVGIIEGFRWCLLGSNQLNITQLLTAVAVTLTLSVLGIRYFRKTERYFADLI